MRTKIKQLLSDTTLLGSEVTVCGWVRTVRAQKQFAFVELSDGSCFATLQIIADTAHIEGITTGSAIRASGTLVKSPGGKQSVELQAKEVFLFGTASPEEYPLQKKRHSFDFLRTIAHLRPRTNTTAAVTRVRNRLAYASHTFFQERGFAYIHTPILTSSDCEGAGELFQVTTLNINEPPRTREGAVDSSVDFFGKPAYLTVSGQLNVEAYACALSDVYTFGPTFRAENSHTSRHLAEFWMIEPEIAFADINEVMDCAEAYLKYLFTDIVQTHADDLEFFAKFIDTELLSRLELVAQKPFARLTYTEAIDILQRSKRSFEYPVSWGIDLQTEHERYLAEEHIKGPLFLTDYPKALKAFYMRNNDDGKTVAAFDVLVPKIGEIIGGSQREERIDTLKQKIIDAELDPETYWWYLELRKYGTVPHGGFGLGFERLVQFVTGMENIRDVIPFPRAPGTISF